MALDKGVDRTLYYLAESTWGDPDLVGTSAQTLGRVTTGLQLSKETYRSARIASHLQMQDMRHGTRRVQGSINDEVSPKTHADFYAAALRKTWTAISNITGLSVTIAGTENPYTITDGANDFLADGLKVGMVVRLTGAGLHSDNVGKNLLVINVTATVVTVIADGGTMHAEGPIGTVTMSQQGKRTWVPGTGHTSPVTSFFIEDWHGAISQSERFIGCRVGNIDVSIPATGMATTQIGFMGKDMVTSGSQWAQTPVAPTTTGICAGIDGAIVAGSTLAQSVVITGGQFSIQTGMSTATVLGSNTTPDVFPGRITVSGQITALFENGTLRDEFLAETESGLLIYAKAGGGVASDFMSWYFPRVKWGSATKDDGEKQIVQTLSFEALYNSGGGSGNKNEQTTIQVCDSALT